MLSNPLHRFSPYHTLPSNTLLSNAHVPTSHLHSTGFETVSPNSQYAFQQLQQHVGVHNAHLARPTQQPKHRAHPYGPGPRSASAAGPIRRRISRACDQCNQLRTKCDGQHPCAHCIGMYLLDLAAKNAAEHVLQVSVTDGEHQSLDWAASTSGSGRREARPPGRISLSKQQPRRLHPMAKSRQTRTEMQSTPETTAPIRHHPRSLRLRFRAPARRPPPTRLSTTWLMTTTSGGIKGMEAWTASRT